jgi:hypothetical protein
MRTRQARSVPLWALLAIALATLVLGFAAARRASAEAIDAIWLGGYAHSFNNAPGRKEAGTGEVEAEADTPQIHALRALGAPRLALTVAINTGGKTDFGGAALVWERRLIGRLSGSVQFGLNLNDGETRAPPGPAGDDLRRTRLQLGSKVLFREAAGLNWRLDRRFSLGVQYIHNSNGEILAHGANESINEIGFRLGVRFGKG